MREDKILVFLSRPNPFLDCHQEFLERLQNRLDKYDLKQSLYKLITMTLQIL